MNDKEFQTLLSACHEVSGYFPDGVVFIGGIAVYMHAVNHRETERFAEFTHDADFYISLPDMGDLRDIEELTPNRRLKKHQMIKAGFEFDIYTERQSSLIVPYEDVLLASCFIEGMRVASLEHLLVLKLEAFRDRMDSSKGDKDAKDILRLAAVMGHKKQPFRSELCLPYLDNKHIELLERVRKGPYALSMAKGNAVVAKKLKEQLSEIIEDLEA